MYKLEKCLLRLLEIGATGQLWRNPFLKLEELHSDSSSVTGGCTKLEIHCVIAIRLRKLEEESCMWDLAACTASKCAYCS